MSSVPGKPIKCADCSGGINTHDPALSLRANQVVDALNVKFKSLGWDRYYGMLGLATGGAPISEVALNDGEHIYYESDGTKHLLVMTLTKLYEISTSTGAATLVYTFTGTGTQASWGDYYGKCFACNGVDACKVESAGSGAIVAYRIGIVPPSTAATTAAAAAGSLAAGVYKIIITYTRTVSGSNVLFSTGKACADVTLTGPGLNATVALTSIPVSSDAQVNNRSIWMTEAGGSTYYYWGSVGDNTTTTYNITSDSNKNTALDYTIEAAYNTQAGAFQWIAVDGDRLFGSINDYLYPSKTSFSSAYNLEKFPSTEVKQFPYYITGLFTLNGYLYLNSNNGILHLNLSDLSAQFVHSEKRFYFLYMSTAKYDSGGIWGLTNDGVRLFDGEKFSDFEYSYNIRPIIDNYMIGKTNVWQKPCGAIIVTGNRTEYRLSYYDSTLATGAYLSMNNRALVLNLSRTMIQDKENFNTPWEITNNTFSGAVIDNTGVAYFLQTNGTNETKALVYKEVAANGYDRYVYESGQYQAGAYNKKWHVKSKNIYDGIASVINPFWFHISALNLSSFTVEITALPTGNGYGSGLNTSTKTIAALTSDQQTVNEYVRKEFPNSAVSGRYFYWKIAQDANDPTFALYEFEIQANFEINDRT